MTARAFARAERCFALAHSTTFVGERDAAIAKGTAIATAAGIDLDRFDIPGRSKSAQVKFKPTGGDFTTARHAPEDYSVEEIGRLREIHLRRMREAAFSDLSDAIDAAARATGARPGETAYDAQRRNFNEACAAAKARDDRHQGSGGAA